ncbi:MAG TPA: alpha/beta fold hydrolase [Longimicrobiaceae bacterium]|nr:alpha/beta fold hydrolase [Longimicrobiaceae bacterium]
MSELAFERALRRWVEDRGIAWEAIAYPRPEAGGITRAFRITPREPRGLVVSVHGAGNDALFAMAGLFRRLLLEGLAVFAFDVDGHGRASTTRFDPGAAGGAVAAAVEESGALDRGLPLHGVGVSLGGALLLHALPRLPFASAALVCAPLRVHLTAGSIANELRPGLLRAAWRGRRLYGATGLIPSFGPIRRDLYPLRLTVPPGPGAFGYVDVLNRTLESLRLEEAARATPCPVLLVYGARDRLVPPEQGERLAALIPRAELLLLPGETHLTTPLAPAAIEAVVRTLTTTPPPVFGCRSSVVGHDRGPGTDDLP